MLVRMEVGLSSQQPKEKILNSWRFISLPWNCSLQISGLEDQAFYFVSWLIWSFWSSHLLCVPKPHPSLREKRGRRSKEKCIPPIPFRSPAASFPQHSAHLVGHAVVMQPKLAAKESWKGSPAKNALPSGKAGGLDLGLGTIIIQFSVFYFMLAR